MDFDISQTAPQPPGRPAALRHPVGTLIVLAAAALGLADDCRAAGLLLLAPTSIAAAPGSSGSFLVLLEDTDPAGAAPIDVAGDSFELRATGPAGLTFTGASIATGATPYLFASSTVGMGLVPFSADAFPTADFTAADIGVPVAGGYPGYTALHPGDIYALGLVSYAIDATAAPGTTYTIAFGPNTALTDQSGRPVAFAVPEPPSWLTAVIAMALAPAVAPLSRRARGSWLRRGAAWPGSSVAV